jgi:hypothetical protein
MSRGFRLVSKSSAGVAAAALAATGLIVGGGGSAGASLGPLLASGVVERDGSVVGGADILVLITPTAHEGATAPTGSTSASFVAGRVKTDGFGRFGVVLDPGKVPTSLMGPGGDARVLVVATDGANQLSWMYSAVRSGSGWATGPGLTRNDRTAPNLKFDLGVKPFAGETHDPSSAWVDTTTGQAMGTSSANFQVPVVRRSAALFDDVAHGMAPGGCGQVTWGTTYLNRTEKYRPDWSWSGADWTVTQTTSESQTMGIGLNLAGRWSESGTAGMTNTTGASASVNNSSDNWILDSVNYRDMTMLCVPGVYRVPVSMYALASGFAYAGHPNYPYCAYPNSGTYSRSSGTAATYGGAIGIGPISVSAQSGFSTASEITWTVTNSTKMCGSTTGWASSPNVETEKN